MKTSFIDDRRNSYLPSEYFPDVCTIQVASSSSNDEGDLVDAWSDYEGHVDLPCSVSPTGGSETKTKQLTYSEATHIISFPAVYSTISTKMRALVNDVPYDIEFVSTSGYDVNTYLEVKVVS